jgi:hypothetical protein
MPVSSACARRICDEFRHQSTDGGFSGAVMFARSLPQYSIFLGKRAKAGKETSERRTDTAATDAGAAATVSKPAPNVVPVTAVNVGVDAVEAEKQAAKES